MRVRACVRAGVHACVRASARGRACVRVGGCWTHAKVSGSMLSICGMTTRFFGLSAMRAISGSSQPRVTSMCESRNVSVSPVATRAPCVRATMRPLRAMRFRCTLGTLRMNAWNRSRSGVPGCSHAASLPSSMRMISWACCWWWR